MSYLRGTDRNGRPANLPSAAPGASLLFPKQADSRLRRLREHDHCATYVHC